MPEPTPASLRIAVLLDCDNVSPKYAGLILEELATYGTPTIKRAYGDWTTTNLNGWKKALNELAIQPVQQFAYTIGKNSSDSALIIDAMDLLWMGNVDAFALVSSDSDFTRLATRLRESGKRVIGLGARKTPASLRNAVDQFIYLELLGTHTDDVDDAEPAPSLEADPSPKDIREAKEGPSTGNRRAGGRSKAKGSARTTEPAEPAEAPAADAPAADRPGSDAPVDETTAAPQRTVRGRGRGAGRGSVLVDVESDEVI
uniref:NYN domain-containing protein n=1 Tax=uncultured Micrococcus sp. TaxID=114051 RepID=UPI0025CC016C